VLGLPSGPYLDHLSEDAKRGFGATRERLASAGCRIQPLAAMQDFEEIASLHNLLLAAEAAQVHAGWYAAYSSRYRAHLSHVILRGQEIDAATLERARRSRQQLRSELIGLMEHHGLDLLLSPAASGPAPRGLANTGSAIMNLPWTHSGLPTLHLPAGSSSSGLPLGIQVTARWQADEELLAWGEEIEPLLPPTRPPKIKLTLH
jgi:Asp-tRNA(Asn)/Glu-tRNA(Gln) amidotransferase A subunit family amidase